MCAHRLLISAGLAVVSLGALSSTPLLAQSPQSAPAVGNAATVISTMDDSVADYRKIIVLMEDAATLDAGNHERVRTVAWILFERNRDRLDRLEEALHADAGKTDSPLTAAFLTRLESNGVFRDADKLAFRDVLDGLANAPAEDIHGAALRKRIGDDAAAMEQIQTLYQKEISQIFSGLQARGMVVHREGWEDYVAYLKTIYKREDILKESESQLPPAESRGGAAATSKLEITGAELPLKTVALTFDDGPHPRYTDQVLAILKKYGLHAVFFEIGKNLGTTSETNEVTLAPTSAASYRVLAAGSTLGNHTYSHPVLPRAFDVRSEIAASALPPSLWCGERGDSGGNQSGQHEDRDLERGFRGLGRSGAKLRGAARDHRSGEAATGHHSVS
jgi:hypothetical protein